MKRMNRIRALLIACLLIALTASFALAGPTVAQEEPPAVVTAVGTTDDTAAAEEPGEAPVTEAAGEPSGAAEVQTAENADAAASTATDAAAKQADGNGKKDVLLIVSVALCAVGIALLAISRILAKRRAKAEAEA